MQILTTTCPACRLLNPGTAVRCDCGYDFTSGTVQKPHLREGGNSREYRMGGILSVVSMLSDNRGYRLHRRGRRVVRRHPGIHYGQADAQWSAIRSEELTSELQSLRHLV